ncbi:DMT family transporter [Aminipila sp.]|uniref:DMT family transporter n=1 Tax=Aminipila sp. TaxID=2060095 RepID=UPI00289B8B75|nr:DMT family transporter [Aminipila sp.]
MFKYGDNSKSIFFAILAASTYAISSPISKLLLDHVQPTMMASLLYLGAGIGLSIVWLIQRVISKENIEKNLNKNDLPYIIAMVVLDISAPIFLMVGLSRTTAANVSLLNNFEIVATSIIAMFIFKEIISKRLWLSISLMTVASMLLVAEEKDSFSFSWGSMYVIFACVCWGFENNCTRKLSFKNPLQVVIIKGIGSGTGALIIALILKETNVDLIYVLETLLLGFVAYGLSIYFYVYAQRELGAAKTSMYYAVAPFIGVILSLIIFREIPTKLFIIALTIMIAGTYFASTDAKEVEAGGKNDFD